MPAGKSRKHLAPFERKEAHPDPTGSPKMRRRTLHLGCASAFLRECSPLEFIPGSWGGEASSEREKPPAPGPAQEAPPAICRFARRLRIGSEVLSGPS